MRPGDSGTRRKSRPKLANLRQTLDHRLKLSLLREMDGLADVVKRIILHRDILLFYATGAAGVLSLVWFLKGVEGGLLARRAVRRSWLLNNPNIPLKPARVWQLSEETSGHVSLMTNLDDERRFVAAE